MFCLGVATEHLQMEQIPHSLSDYGVWCAGLLVAGSGLLFVNKQRLTVTSAMFISLLWLGSFGIGALYTQHDERQAEASWNALLSQSVDQHQHVHVIGYIDGYVQTSVRREQMPVAVFDYWAAAKRKWVTVHGAPRVWLSAFGSGGTESSSLQSGDVVSAPIRLQSLPQGSFADALRRKGIGLMADTTFGNLQKIPATDPANPLVWQGRTQSWVETRAIEAYGLTTAAFLLSFSIGDHMKLSSALVKTFVAIGVVHFTIASGATIRMTVTPIVKRLMGLGAWKSVWLVSGLILTLGMVFLAAFAPPVTRAAMVYGYDLFARFFRKPRDFITANALSLFVMALIQPEWLFDPGVVFSYVAAIAIHWMPQFFASDLFYRVRNVRVRMLISKASALQFGVSPFVAFEFGQFPYFSLLINMFLYPVLEWAIPLSTLFLLIGCANPTRMGGVGSFLDRLFIPLAGALRSLGAQPLNITFAPPPLGVDFAYLGLIILSIWQIRRYNLRKISKYSNG